SSFARWARMASPAGPAWMPTSAFGILGASRRFNLRSSMRVDLSVVSGLGAPQTLQLDAASVQDAGAEAARLGYTVLSASGTRSWLGEQGALPRGAKLDTVVFVEQLRDLLAAGLSVIEALDTLRRGSSGDAAASVEALERRLREGKALSEALAESGAFPDLLVALVRASELT